MNFQSQQHPQGLKGSKPSPLGKSPVAKPKNYANSHNLVKPQMNSLAQSPYAKSSSKSKSRVWTGKTVFSHVIIRGNLWYILFVDSKNNASLPMVGQSLTSSVSTVLLKIRSSNSALIPKEKPSTKIEIHKSLGASGTLNSRNDNLIPLPTIKSRQTSIDKSSVDNLRSSDKMRKHGFLQGLPSTSLALGGSS